MSFDDLTRSLRIVGEIVVAFLILGAIAWKPIRAATRIGRKTGEFLDDWRGEEPRPGYPGRPGIPERLAMVEHEVQANSGQSLKDSVRRIEDKLDTHIDQTENHGGHDG